MVSGILTAAITMEFCHPVIIVHGLSHHSGCLLIYGLWTKYVLSLSRIIAQAALPTANFKEIFKEITSRDLSTLACAPHDCML